MPFNLDDAEQLKRVLIDPMVDALKAEIAPLVARQDKQEAASSALDGRVRTLESYAAKLGSIYAGIVAVVTFVAHWAWQKVKTKYFT